MKTTTKVFAALCLILMITGSHTAYSQARLIGTTQNGGTNAAGTIISYTGGASSISRILNLPANTSSRGPASSTMTEASNGKLYGVNSFDRTYGTIYEYDYMANTYTVKATFDSAKGINPKGSLLIARSGKMYGISSAAGAHNGGTVFSYRIGDTAITKLADLPADVQTYGSFMQASNGKLYALLRVSSAIGGMICSYDVASGAFDIVDTLGSFSFPFGELLEIGRDSLYGLTYADGANGGGTLFRYIAGTRTHSVIYDMPSAGESEGNLIKASDGKLYGLNTSGGANFSGCIFRFDLASRTYTVLHSFGAGTDGESAYGSLVMGSDSILYGFTYGGGANGSGTILQYNTRTNLYSKKVDLNPTTGTYPSYGHLVEYAAHAITSQPVSVTVCEGTTVTFTAGTSGSPDSLQWQYSTDSGVVYHDIPGARDTTLSMTAVPTVNTLFFRAVLSDATADTSDAVSFTALARGRTVTTQLICAGDSFIYRGTVYHASGIYSDTLRGLASNGCDSIISLHLTVHSPYVAVIQSGLVLTADGDSFISYQWYEDSIQIPGAVDTVYTPAHNGYYHVEVVDSSGCHSRSQSIYVSTVGMRSISDAAIARLYPSPSTGTFILDCSQPSQVSITDAVGRTIANGMPVVSQQLFQLKSLPEGIYYMHISAEHGEQNIRFSIIR